MGRSGLESEIAGRRGCRLWASASFCFFLSTETAAPLIVICFFSVSFVCSGAMASMMLCSSYSMPAAAAARRGSGAASLGFATSQLAGVSLNLAASSATTAVVVKHTIVARRICPFLEKKTNRANKVSFSNHKTKKQQFVNLQYKKLWWEAGKRYVKLRLSTKALKTIEKHGLDAVAKKAGIDLNKK